ncbi:MAG: hypothetical protein ACPGYK_06290 [Flavobacteriales bacterium]
MPSRAVIDCGTNTFHLSIAQSDEALTPVFSQRIPVRVGQGGFRAKSIRVERMARALDAIQTLKETCWNYEVEDIVLVGTSAIRDAQNREELIEAAKRLTGLEMRVLSGWEEAYLIQLGVESTCPDQPESPWLTMDIGGGSVELILWSTQTDFVRSAWSLDLGVSRLADLGSPPDPLMEQGVAKFDAFLEAALSPIIDSLSTSRPGRLVGASGSFETFAELLGRTFDSSAHALKLDRVHFHELARTLLATDLRGRLGMKGMAPDRAPFIPLSVLLVEAVLDRMPSEAELWVSPAALREGVLRAEMREGGLATYLQSLPSETGKKEEHGTDSDH